MILSTSSADAFTRKNVDRNNYPELRHHGYASAHSTQIR